MSIEALPPGLILILGALAFPFVGPIIRRALILLLPLAALAQVWALPDGPGLSVGFLHYTLVPVQADALSRLFATIFLIAAAAGGLFAFNQNRTVELVAAFIYGGSAVGVALAGDLITVFVFWEVMAIGSTLVLWSEGGLRAARAATRYVQMHLFGGVVLMAGLVAHVAATGDISFHAMRPESIGTWLILIGFLINAGAPPFSAWLPDAYGEASWSGMVFLSAFTTKTAVYVLMRGFPGIEILIWVGMAMVVYGIIYALMENDMRRILAYSIITQVGLMVTAIGIGSELALNGAAAHAFVHILYKALLLMSAGSVLYMTGKRKCTELGGLWRSMPITTACAVIGAATMCAVPLTAGFASKSLISASAAEAHMAWVWFAMAGASAAAIAYAGLKYPFFVFFHKDAGLKSADPPLSMRVAMVGLAAACVVLGAFPGLLYGLLPYAVDYQPYTIAHVVEILQLLGFAALAFFMLLPLIKPTPTVSVDQDWLYRGLGLWFVRQVGDGVVIADRQVRKFAFVTLRRIVDWVEHTHGPNGFFARTSSSGAMALFTVMLLAGFLALFYA